MGSWVALVLAVAGGTTALETRYFATQAECATWAARITTPPGAIGPATGHQVAHCLHVRELIAQLALGR